MTIKNEVIKTLNMNNSSTLQQRKVKCRILIFAGILQLLLLNNTVTAQCTAPGAEATVTDTLSCGTPTVTLTGSSVTSNVSYSWSGPNGFVSFSPNPVVSLPGEYILTVTTSVGGCTSTDTLEVLQDTVQPDASALVSGMINCTDLSVTLEAVTSIPDPSFWWIGPGGYTSAQQSPSTATSGGYTLIVTDQSNGCASTATVYVEKSVAPPLVSAYVSGKVTCTTSSVQLTSSSPTSSAIFSWSGPGDFTSDQQNTTAQMPGLYTVIATNPNNTCTSSASVNVLSDTVEPGAFITASNEVITCTAYNATLYGSSPAIGVNYSWSGPNGYTSGVQNPIVVNPGDYILTITRVSTGCVSTDTINITQNKVRPGAIAMPSGQITCGASAITLQGSSPAAAVTYKWLGAGFNSTQQNPTTSNPGPYLLIVTDTDNGCTSSAPAYVQQNTTPPASVTAANDGPLTCADTSAILTGNSSTPGVTYSWSGPDDFTSALQNPVTDTSGTYFLTVTNPVNSCTATANTTVAENITPPASVTAGNNGTLNCLVHNINLSGSSGSSGVAYSWSGPDNFVSAVQNPVVDVPGTYILTVTRAVNGCIDTASTTVSQDTIVPSNVLAENNGPLTCANISANLTASSSTAGVLYSWEGPNGYSSTSQNPLVSLPGEYYLTVTNPANYCSDSAGTFLVQDTLKPVAVTAVNNGPLTCITDSVTLSGNSSTSGATFSWTGPGDFISSLQNPVTDTLGTYVLTVTNPLNGCTVTRVTSVGQNIELPSAVNAVNNGPLTCSDGSVTLTGSSVTPGVVYSWDGPNGFTSASATPTTEEPGTYIVTVTNPVNGCAVSDSTLIEQDVDLPVAVAASNNGPLTCLTTSITISGNSTTTGVTYSWNGPSGFVSASKNPTVDEPGTYYLTVTDPANGCSVSDSTIVEQDDDLPANVLATNDGPLTCTDTTASLSGNSSTPGVSYTWSGPGGFSSLNQHTVVDSSGTYFLTVTDQINGCFVMTSTLVVQNKLTPGVTAAVFDTITCEISSVSMSASSFTSGVGYSWVGPENFSSTEQYPFTSVPGDYTVTVTDPVNGCTSSQNITVGHDTIAPDDVLAVISDTLTCLTPDVTLLASSSTGGVMYSWEGPNGYFTTEQNPVVNLKGDYELTVTNESNGCTGTDNVTVIENKVAPQDANAEVSGIITCYDPKVELAGSSSTPGVTYTWSGPGFTSSLQTDSVSNPGTYNLTVTDPGNGCIATDIIAVSRNITIPQGVSTNVSGTLSCTNPAVTISANSATGTVEYAWSGPNDFATNEQSPAVSDPGPYTVTITNTVSGCITTRTVNVNQNIALPADVSASVADVLTCDNQFVTLTGTSTTPGAAFSWTGPNGFTSGFASPIVEESGNYTLVVTHPSSGCADTVSTTVSEDVVPPADVTASAASDLNCVNPFVMIMGTSSTPGVNYHWEGPMFYESNNDFDFIFSEGTYVLTVTNTSNGCVAVDSVTVNADFTNPDVTAQGAAITCTEQTVTITASSATPGVSYAWTGPGLVSSPDVQNPLVNAAGNYTVTVVNPVNGCDNSAVATVSIDTVTPDLSITASGNGIVTCSGPSVTLTASTATPGVTFTWTGYGSQNPVSVTEPDIYVVTALNPVNGCTRQANAVVTQDTLQPELTVDAGNSGLLTCAVPLVDLAGTSLTPNTSITWTGYPAGQNVISVNSPGIYYATAQNTVNGCTRTQSATIIQDITIPDDVGAIVSGDLNCVNPLVSLTGISSTTDVTFFWTGPDNFGSSDEMIFIFGGGAGDYTLTVTRSDNGCSDSITVTVFEDYEAPACNIILPPVSPVELQVNTISAQELNDVTYTWSISSDPGWSIVSGQGTPELTYMAGAEGTSATITLTITNNGNGCYSDCNAMLTAAVSGFKSEELSDLGGMEINVYPNPFSDEAWVEFISADNGYVTVDIFNINGLLVKRLFEDDVKQSNLYRVVIDGSNMQAGTYHWIIKTVDNVYTGKLIHDGI
jgi:hypothetical protein